MAASVFLSGILAASVAGDPIQVVERPQAGEIVADGRIEPGEWEGAATFALADGVRLHLMADEDRLYVAASSRSSGARYTDLFIAAGDGCLVNLHASMRVGERTLPAEGWDDRDPPWSWGNNQGWAANTVDAARSAAGELIFAPSDGQEFVIERSRFDGELAVRVEVRDFHGEAEDVVFPAQSTRHDRSTWAKLRLGDVAKAPGGCLV